MLKNKWFACATVALTLAAAGCSGTPEKTAAAPAEPVAPTPTATTSTGTPATTPTTTAATNTGTPSTSQSVIYFEFDSSELKPASEAVIAAWSKYLTANPTVKVQLQGNAAERGTREYNIGLGERRAQTVSSALQAAGVSAGQLSLVSYGEEHPVALGHDEASWSQNRRVEIVAQ